MVRLILIASASLFLGITGAALAQDTEESHPSVRKACAQDFHQYCADAHTREDRRQCREQNKDKFSDACKAALAAAQSRHSGQ